MFVGFYQCKAVGVGDANVYCLLGRGGLTVANHSVTVKKQLLTHSLETGYSIEGDRLLAISQAQDLFTLTNAIDPDIAVMSRALLAQIRTYVIANPTKKASVKVSIEQYKSNHMFYLDWEDRWATIQEMAPELIGLYYIKYAINEGGVKSVQEGTFELQAV